MSSSPAITLSVGIATHRPRISSSVSCTSARAVHGVSVTVLHAYLGWLVETAPCADPRRRRLLDGDRPARARLARRRRSRASGETSCFAAPEPLEDFCLGVEQHDVGWSEWDLRPPLHAPAGRAASVFEAPLVPRTALWLGASRRVLTQSPGRRCCVSLHATNLYAETSDAYEPEIAVDRAASCSPSSARSRTSSARRSASRARTRRARRAALRARLALARPLQRLARARAAAGRGRAIRFEPLGRASGDARPVAARRAGARGARPRPRACASASATRRRCRRRSTPRRGRA